MEVLDPVTYIVETKDGSRWKRHADQLKDWLLSCSPALSEVVPESLADQSDDPPEDSTDSSRSGDTEPEQPAEPRDDEPGGTY